jgi:hypothetical protein
MHGSLEICYHHLLDDVIDAAPSDLLCSALVVNSSLGPSSFYRLASTLQRFTLLLHSSLPQSPFKRTQTPNGPFQWRPQTPS